MAATQPASFLSARRTASFLQQEEVMFYLETLLYIDHCINVPATGFGKAHFIEGSHKRKDYCHSHVVRGGTRNSGEGRCTHAAKLLGEWPFIRGESLSMLNTQFNIGSSHNS